MKRNYTLKTLDSVLTKLRSLKTNVPVSLGADIIIGFPGETDDDFQATYDMYKTLEFNDAFIYKYNIRENTLASKDFIDDVDDKTKTIRLSKLLELKETIQTKKLNERIGLTLEVLADNETKKNKSLIFSLSKNQDVVLYKSKSDDLKGVKKVLITGVKGHALFGEEI